MGGWWCCPKCRYFWDKFDRADGTDLGSDWTEQAGSWSIASETLATPDSNALAVSTKNHPAGQTAVTCEAWLKGANAGDQLRIVVGYVDPNNYYYAQITWGLSGNARLYRRSGGVDTLLASVAHQTQPGYKTGFRVCIDDRLIAINSISYATAVLVADATSTSSRCGLGTGTVSAPAAFDDFRLYRHHSTDPECDACLTPCSGCIDGKSPAYLQATLSGWAEAGALPPNVDCGCCAANDGVYILQRQPIYDSVFFGGCWYQWTGTSACYLTELVIVLFPYTNRRNIFVRMRSTYPGSAPGSTEYTHVVWPIAAERNCLPGGDLDDVVLPGGVYSNDMAMVRAYLDYCHCKPRNVQIALKAL